MFHTEQFLHQTQRKSACSTKMLLVTFRKYRFCIRNSISPCFFICSECNSLYFLFHIAWKLWQFKRYQKMYVRTFLYWWISFSRIGPYSMGTAKYQFCMSVSKMLKWNCTSTLRFIKGFWCVIHSKFPTHPLKPQTVNLFQPSVHKRIFAMVQFKRIDFCYHLGGKKWM